MQGLSHRGSVTHVGAWDPRKDSSPSSLLPARLDDEGVYLDFPETADSRRHSCVQESVALQST